MASHSWYTTTSYLFYGLRYYFLAYKYAVLHAEASEDFPKVTKLEEGKKWKVGGRVSQSQRSERKKEDHKYNELNKNTR